MNTVPGPSRRHLRPAEMSLLDRLTDPEPEREHDRPHATAEALAQLRRSVRRDVEALLNARRPWRSVPGTLAALHVSPLGYGMPDITAGAFNDRRQREALRVEVEETIRRFEPRLAQVQVQLAEDNSQLRATLRLRIDALLRIRPAPEPIVLDTTIDADATDVVLEALHGS